MRGRKLVIVTVVAALALVGSHPAGAQARGPAPKSGAAAPKGPEAKPGTPEKGELKPGQRSNSPIVIDADRMEAFKREGLVVFTGNVVAKQDNSTQTADRMEVYLDEKGERVVRIISTGSVKIVTEDCRTGTARRAEYYDDEQRLLLLGDAKVWQDENVVTGEEIELLLAEDRSTVKGGSRERVKSIFYPKREEPKPAKPGTKKEEKQAASCG
ncbi:MAG: lipopolysaccharide transport periplasmic protein LptA [Candidatus Rokubacteria bacterium]|nr:lipopolysaccharide transport periplasmic protein LptA [Candidatus Rokubacteria bacterium]